MQRLRNERGIALVMALGLMIGFAIIVTGAVSYSTSNTRSANSSQKRVSARQVAEAGMAAALAVLDNGSPTNSAALGDSTHQLTTNVDGGTASYYGVLTNTGGETYWTITSTGSVANPSGGSGQTTSSATTTAKVPIAPSELYQSTPASNPWTFWWSTDTANACDQTFTKQVSIPLVMYGDLCVDWATGTTNPSGLVGGGGISSVHMKTANSTIWVKNMSSRVGNTTNPMTTAFTVQAAAGLKCKTSYNGATGLSPHTCYSADKSIADATHLTRDNVITPIGSSPTGINSITADFDYWYHNASPGPFSGCNASSTHTGTAVLPVFENETSNPQRNNSVPTVQDLTPAGGTYDCLVGTNNGAGNGWCNSGSNNQNLGEIKWDGSNLEVVGTMYIDGSVKISNAALTTKTYTCWGAIYTSGTILVKNTKLCAALFDSGCTGATGVFSRWWPFLNWLFLVADGDGATGGAAAQGGDVGSGDGIKFINSTFQGGAYATKAIHFDASAATGFQGPAMAGTLIFDKDFATVGWDQSSSRMPTGTPGIQQDTNTRIKQPIYGG